MKFKIKEISFMKILLRKSSENLIFLKMGVLMWKFLLKEVS